MDRKLIDLAIDQTLAIVGDRDCIIENFLEEFNQKLNFIEKMLEITGTPTTKKNDGFLDRLVEDVFKHGRARNPLINDGILTIRQLVDKTPFELLRVVNFGQYGLNIVTETLRENGYALGVKQKKLL